MDRNDTRTMYISDALNARPAGRGEPDYILDADAIGAQLKPTASYRDWMAGSAHAWMAVHAGTLAELAAGREPAWMDPGYAALLERTYSGTMSRIDQVVMPSHRLDTVAARLRAAPDVSALLSIEAGRNPSVMGRVEVAAAAIAYGFVIVSGNGFYRKLARVTTLDRGVYDPSLGRWIVEPGLRPGRVRDRVARYVPA